MATLPATRCTVKLMYNGTLLVMTFYPADGKATADAYDLREVGSDSGRTFRLTKHLLVGEGLDARRVRTETYSVTVCGDGSQGCSCPAGRYRGLCRHTAPLRALVDAGILEGGYPGGEPEVSEEGE